MHDVFHHLRVLFSDYTFQVVALGSALLGLVSGVLGCFAVLRKQSLLGDGVSHAALPGVVLMFLLTGSRQTELLLGGALVTGLLATLIMIGIAKYSRLKFDAILAVVMSVFFGFGMVLLTFVQKLPNAAQAGLKQFIYGQASALMLRDVSITAASGVVLLFLVCLLWKEFKLFCFDPVYANTVGFQTNRLNILLSLMIVISIIIGLQTVGVVLMSAMLIAPAVAARQWCNSLSGMVLLAAVFGASAGFGGTVFSTMMENMPTGPSIVVFASLFALISICIAPGRGILSALIHRKRQIKAQRKEG